MLRQHPDPFSVSAERDPMPPVPGGGVHDGQDSAGQLHRGEFLLGARAAVSPCVCRADPELNAPLLL